MYHVRVDRFLIGGLLVGLVACGGSDGTGPETGGNTLTVSRTTATLTFLGETVTFTATLRDPDGVPVGTGTWTSDAPTVATVTSSGVATAVANGQATLRAVSGSLSASATVTVQQAATVLAIVSGDDQTGTVGQVLSEPLVVRVEDRGGSAVSGASLLFTAGDGSGSVTETTATSDADGRASTTWTLGTTAGPQEVTAAIAGVGSAEISLSATAIAGEPTTFTKESGDQQDGETGQPLPDPVVVALRDEFGNGVPGTAVTFTIASGGGTVSPAGATTGSDGAAQATWTMGNAVRATSLTASTAGFPALGFTATAALHVQRADLTLGALVVAPSNPTSLQDIDVTATITNSGDLTTQSSFDVQLLVDGVQAATTNLAALAPGATADVSFTVGPLVAGSHTLRMVVDPADVVDESDESNNSAEQSTPVATALQLSANAPITDLSADTLTELLFTLELPGPAATTLVISTAEGTGDVDLYVHPGERPPGRDDYLCRSGGPRTEESCTFNVAEPGTYHIVLFAFTPFSGTTLRATVGGPAVPFDIELIFVTNGTPTQDDVVRSAASRWERIIRDDLNGRDFSSSPVPANACVEGQPLIDGVIEDMQIYVTYTDIDGPGSTFASAVPCLREPLSGLTLIGVVTLDLQDVQNLEGQGILETVVVHEMGHALGIGSLWTLFGLLQNPSSSNPGVDTHFTGPLAIAAFDAAGGTGYSAGDKVPVENVAGPGSSDGHWRQSVFVEEMMTPFVQLGFNPLSAISLQSLADLGYRVDLSQADPYNLPAPAALRVPGTRPGIYLGNDLAGGPIFVVQPEKGRR